LKILDSGFHRNDGKRAFSTFYDFINIGMAKEKLQMQGAQILKNEAYL